MGGPSQAGTKMASAPLPASTSKTGMAPQVSGWWYVFRAPSFLLPRQRMSLPVTRRIMIYPVATDPKRYAPKARGMAAIQSNYFSVLRGITGPECRVEA